MLEELAMKLFDVPHARGEFGMSALNTAYGQASPAR